jgi:hypothetical protein
MPEADMIFETPNWEPLRQALGVDCTPDTDHGGPCPVDDWMWMYAAPPAGERPRIEAYKHRNTRHYVMLDADGHVYRWRSGRPSAEAYERLGISALIALEAATRL